MKSIAFFNNKGGVGKTSLVYHLTWMFSDMGYRVITADLDPQANLSSIFLHENRLVSLWNTQNLSARATVDGSIAPLFDGTGDIQDNPYMELVNDNLGLLVGDLQLSTREDDLAQQWPRCLAGDKRAFRVTTTFARLVENVAATFDAELALIDVGPNLGALNRAALIACDYVIIPLAPDLFSLEGLGNVGPRLEYWRRDWQDRVERKPADLDLQLPDGGMQPLGYVIMRHPVRLDRPIQAYQRWIDQIPKKYHETILKDTGPAPANIDTDANLLAYLKDYRSLMPLAHESNKPMFKLKPADGAIGAQQQAVQNCYQDFRILAQKILDKMKACEANRES